MNDNNRNVDGGAFGNKVAAELDVLDGLPGHCRNCREKRMGLDEAYRAMLKRRKSGYIVAIPVGMSLISSLHTAFRYFKASMSS